MTRAFEALLADIRSAFDAYPTLARFCPIPDDLRATSVSAFDHPAARLMLADPMDDAVLPDLRDHLKAASPHAKWRETYNGTAASPDLLARFACYCIVGAGGAWISDHWAAYVVYMPPDLDYPRHEHPAEEIYFIVAGRAEFAQGSEPYHTAEAGSIVYHSSGTPHATRTTDHSMLALVFWRNHFETAPVWSSDAVFT